MMTHEKEDSDNYRRLVTVKDILGYEPDEEIEYIKPLEDKFELGEDCFPAEFYYEHNVVREALRRLLIEIGPENNVDKYVLRNMEKVFGKKFTDELFNESKNKELLE